MHLCVMQLSLILAVTSSQWRVLCRGVVCEYLGQLHSGPSAKGVWHMQVGQRGGNYSNQHGRVLLPGRAAEWSTLSEMDRLSLCCMENTAGLHCSSNVLLDIQLSSRMAPRFLDELEDILE